MGRDAELQPLQIRPRFAAAHAIHAAIAVVGSVVAIDSPTTGSALVAIAVALTFLDVAGVLQVVRRLTGTRASQNIESRESGRQARCGGPERRGLRPRPPGSRARLATRILRNPWLALLAAMGAILAVLRAAAGGCGGNCAHRRSVRPDPPAGGPDRGAGRLRALAPCHRARTRRGAWSWRFAWRRTSVGGSITSTCGSCSRRRATVRARHGRAG